MTEEQRTSRGEPAASSGSEALNPLRSWDSVALTLKLHLHRQSKLILGVLFQSRSAFASYAELRAAAPGRGAGKADDREWCHQPIKRLRHQLLAALGPEAGDLVESSPGHGYVLNRDKLLGLLPKPVSLKRENRQTAEVSDLFGLPGSDAGCVVRPEVILGGAGVPHFMEECLELAAEFLAGGGRLRIFFRLEELDHVISLAIGFEQRLRKQVEEIDGLLWIADSGPRMAGPWILHRTWRLGEVRAYIVQQRFGGSRGQVPDPKLQVWTEDHRATTAFTAAEQRITDSTLTPSRAFRVDAGMDLEGRERWSDSITAKLSEHRQFALRRPAKSEALPARPETKRIE